MEREAIAYKFPYIIKEQVRREQKGCCLFCHEKPKNKSKLQVHHKIADSVSHDDTRGNAVGLCTPDHVVADTLSIKHGISFEQVQEFINLHQQISKR